MSGIFDRDPETIKQTAEATLVPINYEDPRRFNLTGDRGSINFNPDTGDIKTKSGIPSILGRRNELLGNENALIQARVRPFQESLQRRIADVNRSLTKRGVTGSLLNNELNNITFQGNREIADQTAMGRAEAIQMDQSLLKDALTSELATMGLGLEGLRTVLGDRRQTTTPVSGTTTTTTSGGGGDLAAGLTGILDFLKGLG